MMDISGHITTNNGPAALCRRHCPRCDDREALIARGICCSCLADLSQSKPIRRGRGRPPRAFTIKGPRARTAPLRTPIAEDGDNLLTLMSAKQ
jgi:hypothetical protein